METPREIGHFKFRLTLTLALTLELIFRRHGFEILDAYRIRIFNPHTYQRYLNSDYYFGFSFIATIFRWQVPKSLLTSGCQKRGVPCRESKIKVSENKY